MTVASSNSSEIDTSPRPTPEGALEEVVRIRPRVRPRRSPPSTPPGARLGPYVLLERLATGGMAEIHVAKREGGGELLAVKRMLDHLVEEERYRTMFQDETEIASRLRHPNIVRVLGSGESDEAPYIAMELLPGRNLRQVLRRLARDKGLPPLPVAWIGARICDALAYAHELRDEQDRPLSIVHRDISPQNVVIGYNGAVKLIDFGVAKANSRTTTTQTGIIKGKVRYMSPEQVRGEPVDHRSDLFALGTCLYEMLTSVCPFAEPDALRTLHKVRAATVVPPRVICPDVHPELSVIVLKALAKDREERFQSAREMGAALEAYVLAASGEEPFGAAQLAEWMQATFLEDRQREAEWLSSLMNAHDVRDVPVAELPHSPLKDLAEEMAGVDPLTGATDSLLELISVDAAVDPDGDMSVLLDEATNPRVLIQEATDAALRSPVDLDEDASRDTEVTTSLPDAAPRRRTRGKLMVALALGFAAGVGVATWTMSGPSGATIEVRTVPEVPARVRIDGQSAGRAPSVIRDVSAGEHEILVDAEGWRPARQRVSVEPDGTTVLVLELTPIAASPTVTSLPELSARSSPPERAGMPTNAAPPAADEPRAPPAAQDVAIRPAPRATPVPAASAEDDRVTEPEPPSPTEGIEAIEPGDDAVRVAAELLEELPPTTPVSALEMELGDLDPDEDLPLTGEAQHP